MWAVEGWEEGARVNTAQPGNFKNKKEVPIVPKVQYSNQTLKWPYFNEVKRGNNARFVH